MASAETDYYVSINNESIDDTVWGAYITLMPGDVLHYNAFEYMYLSRVEYYATIDYPSLSSGHYLPTVASITDSTITGLTAHGYEQRIIITQVSGISGTNDYSALSAGSITCTVGGVSVDLIGDGDDYWSTGVSPYYYGSIAGMTGDVVVTVTGTGYGIGVWMDFGVTYNGTQRMMAANTSGEITTINKLSSDYTLLAKAYNETLLGLNVSLNKAVFSYGDIDASSSTYTKYTSGIPWVITNNDVLTELYEGANKYDSYDYYGNYQNSFYYIPVEEQTIDLTLTYQGEVFLQETVTFNYILFYGAPETGDGEGFVLYLLLASGGDAFPEDMESGVEFAVIEDSNYATTAMCALHEDDITFTATTSSGGTLTIGSTELTEANLIKLLALLE